MDFKSLVISYIAIVFSQNVNSLQESMYLSCNATNDTCDDNTIKLDFNISSPTGDNRCSSQTRSQIRDTNVICLDKNRSGTPVGISRPCDYRLTGCPGIFTSSFERTEGVCTHVRNQSDKELDLHLNIAEMEEGLYNFSCFYNDDSGSSNYVSNYAIVVNGNDTYKDILLFVNGKTPDPPTPHRVVNSGRDNLTIVREKVSINEGDNLTIIARAVGQVSRVEVLSSNASGSHHNETRFICFTCFLCGILASSNLDGRYQLCTLNAAIGTDNQTLHFSIHNDKLGKNISTEAELGEIIIAVNPSIPSTTTSTITDPPMPTGSSPTPEAGDSNVVVIVVIVVVIVLVIIILLIIGLLLHYCYIRDKQKTDNCVSPNGPVSNVGKMKMLMYACTCDHINVEPLVSKLNSNADFYVEKLTDNPPSSFDDNNKILYSEISQGSVLVDCSCPGGDHSTMHKAVKCYTQKPSGDPNSSKWYIIRLNKCGNNPEIPPSSWSKLFGYIDVIDYSDINGVIDNVERKLREYLHSRTSSIHSSENEVDTCHKKRLLHSEERQVGRQVGAARDKISLEEVQKGVQGLHEKVDALKSQNAQQHEEVTNALTGQKEDIQQIATLEEAISKDTRTLVSNVEEN